jgi:transketolase
MVIRSKKGHFPSSSSCTEILITLMYGGWMKYDPTNPQDPDRDRLFISKGHAGMALYPILEERGFVPKGELARFAKADGVFKFYPDSAIPGVEAITGSLGHGVGIAAGHCIAGRQDGRHFRSFVIIGDGECYEGSVWETAMFAAHHKLKNLIVFLDRNRCCILDHTENCVALDPLDDKWKSFGWHVISVDAHNLEQLDAAMKEATSPQIDRPVIVIAHSTKGKGVSFMEDKPGWHNRMPTAEEVAIARKELGIAA